MMQAESITHNEQKKGSMKSNRKNLWKLILGTALGIIFFTVPFKVQDEMIILYSYASHAIVEAVQFFPAIIMLTTIISALLAFFFTYLKKNEKGEMIQELFVVSPLTLLLRTAAAIVSICVYFEIGHPFIFNEYTGGLVVNDLMPTLFIMFFFALSFIPLLLGYGAMELFGSIFKPIFRLLFKLPGTSSILAIGSWIGSGTVGILSTDIEYEKGRLTGKEAAILVFGFCTISLPSTFVYTTVIGGLEVAAFPYFYLTLLICGVVTTMVISRIPPISRKSNAYFGGKKREEVKEDSLDTENDEMGLDAALKRAESAPGLLAMVKSGSKKAVSMYMDAFPIIILTATIALIVSEYTPVFDIMAIPFTPILEAIGLPEAAQAGPAFIVGFVDLLLPFLAAGTITSQLTKFVICAVGVMQIICLSETGAVVLKSKLPISMLELAIVVFQKTIITIPIALLIGKLIGLE